MSITFFGGGVKAYLVSIVLADAGNLIMPGTDEAIVQIMIGHVVC